MIELNLLPKEMQRRKKIPKKRKGDTEVSGIDMSVMKELPQLPMGPVVITSIAVLAGLIAVQIMLMVLVYNNGKQAEGLIVKWEEMQPQKEKTDSIVMETNRLEKRIQAMREITRPDLDWSELLSGLNEAVIPRVWLNGLDLKYKKSDKGTPELLELDGFALGNSGEATAIVSKFIRSLKSNENFFKYFDDIELDNIRSNEVAGEEAMAFKMTCRFKQK